MAQTKLKVTQTADSLRSNGVGWSSSAAPSTGDVGLYPKFPVAGTISSVTITVDAGTMTVKFWKIAAGTAVPTITNVINTSGISISSGTVLYTTTLTDFTSTAVTAGDIFGMDITAVSGVGSYTVELGITKS